MVLASLLVMGVVAYLSFDYQQETRLKQNRSQGTGLARVLGGMSWDELVPKGSRQGILQALQQGQNNPDYAYGILVDKAGTPVAGSAEPGVSVPDETIPDTPAGWLGERIVKSTDGAPSFLEFHAPVFSRDELKGYVRIGYQIPGFGLGYEDLPYFASLVFPVFLLTPLFYFLLRREITPLRKLNENVEQMIENGGPQKLELHPSGELGEFIQRFMEFANKAKERIHALEGEQSGLLTSNKLLSYRQTRVESILKTLPEAILVIDEAGTVNYANDKITGLLGIEVDEVVGKKPQEWCSNPSMISYLSRCSANGGQVGYISDSIEISPEHDSDRHLEVKAYPLFSPKDGSHMLGSMVVIRDCTEEQLLRRSRGEFVAQIAHELKTPLNVLAMYSESLLGEDGNSEEFRVEAVNVIHDEVERLSTLINNMLALSKIELGGLQLNRQRVRLHELLEDAFNNVKQSGRGKGLTFRLDLPKEMSAVYVDKDLFRIAVNNLLTNAIKYNRPDGEVSLSAEEINGVIEINVHDTGLGISPDDQKKVFDKFFRSNDDEVRKQTGHGLGLSLVQQIIQLHHGQLDLESNYGKGSKFIIRLDRDTEITRKAATV